MSNKKKNTKSVPFFKNNGATEKKKEERQQPEFPHPLVNLPAGTRWVLVLDDRFEIPMDCWTGVHELVGYAGTRMRNRNAIEEDLIQIFLQRQRAMVQATPPPPPEDDDGDDGEQPSMEELQEEIARLQSMLAAQNEVVEE